MTEPSKRQAAVHGSTDAAGVAKGQRTDAAAPGLWIVATPIGNARDITLRALDILRGADVLVCEDTRRTRHLMEIHGIPAAGRPVLSYNDRNGASRRETVMTHLRGGAAVAYCSDAGTPLIADPGYRLVAAARAEGIAVHTAPGCSAVLTALSIAGLPTDRFLFAGFLPQKRGQKQRDLQALAAVPATIVLFESARRLVATLEDIAAVFGDGHEVVIARELTKRFEEIVRGEATDLAARYAAEGDPKGEIVLLIARREMETAESPEELETLLRAALAEHSTKDAARIVSEATGQPRRDLYTLALTLGDPGD